MVIQLENHRQVGAIYQYQDERRANFDKLQKLYNYLLSRTLRALDNRCG
jgi:hypothetical protein